MTWFWISKDLGLDLDRVVYFNARTGDIRLQGVGFRITEAETARLIQALKGYQHGDRPEA